MIDKCPTCSRAFEELEDYPLIYVKSFERRELPETITSDWRSETLPEKKLKNCLNEPMPKKVLELFRRDGKDSLTFENCLYEKYKLEDGVQWYTRKPDITQEVKQAAGHPDVKKYLEDVESLVGQEIPTRRALPKLGRHSYFKYSFPLSGTEYSLSLSEKKQKKVLVGEDACEICLYGRGPNFGSAGGPSIIRVAILAKLEYEGRIRG